MTKFEIVKKIDEIKLRYLLRRADLIRKRYTDRMESVKRTDDGDLDPEGWVTINNAKVNIGEGGEILAGMGGKYTGQNIGEISKGGGSSSSESRNVAIESRIADIDKRLEDILLKMQNHRNLETEDVTPAELQEYRELSMEKYDLIQEQMDLETSRQVSEDRRAEQELQAQSDNTFDSLSGAEFESVKLYTGVLYADINSYLRGTRDFTETERSTLDTHIQNIDSAMDQFNLNDDTIVLRGDNFNPYISSNQGDVITLEAFTSTTLNRETAEEFAGREGHLTEIRVPRGTRCIYIGNNTMAVDGGGESELLLGRGLQYRIVETSNNRTILEVLG